jgi:CDP-diacylglycerol--glycerol-3-phosphate 3-phosphatidyltransferase
VSLSAPWQAITRGYLRLVEPLADGLVAAGVRPNTITTLGLIGAIAAGTLFASGEIRWGGWVLAVTAVFDVLDGVVARRSGAQSRFGAFFDSTVDRVSDAALLGGLAVFWARVGPHHSIEMVAIALVAITGAFLTSYARARAESIGLDAKVGVMQRPERVVLLAAPQALFGLAFDGWLLKGVVVVLALTAWITVAQRVAFVHRSTGADRR